MKLDSLVCAAKGDFTHLIGRCSHCGAEVGAHDEVNQKRAKHLLNTYETTLLCYECGMPAMADMSEAIVHSGTPLKEIYENHVQRRLDRN